MRTKVRKKEEGRGEREIRKRGVGEDIVDAWCMIRLTRQWWTQPPVKKAVVDPTTHGLRSFKDTNT
jgi:hypothetical protein